MPTLYQEFLWIADEQIVFKIMRALRLYQEKGAEASNKGSRRTKSPQIKYLYETVLFEWYGYTWRKFTISESGFWGSWAQAPAGAKVDLRYSEFPCVLCIFILWAGIYQFESYCNVSANYMYIRKQCVSSQSFRIFFISNVQTFNCIPPVS